ncbi:MAG: LamG domain-containing protein [Gemmatimonadaceae bacterium]|nr:LamG domain-containing protein [Gemmatimonadaceae bacterium]
MAGIDTYTKLMLHCDGADASTTFTDSEITPKTVTAVGNAQIDTAQSKFGGASALFDGTGDYLTTPDHADFDPGSGNYTWDMWLRVPATGTYYIASQLGAGATDRAYSLLVTATTIGFNYATSSGSAWANQWTFAWTPSINTQYHIAWVRNGADFKVFLDGTQIGVTQNISTDTIRNSGSEFVIASNTDAQFPLNGWLDEIRFSKGIARWTANFTPPTEAYSVSRSLVYRDRMIPRYSLLRR